MNFLVGLFVILIHATAFGGVINGNGEAVGSYHRTDVPNVESIFEYLGRLKQPEHTWAKFLESALLPDEGPLFAKTSERCYQDVVSPETEIRSFYKDSSKIVILCQKFFDSETDDQVVAIIHEVTHFVLYKLKHEQAGDLEEVIKLMDTAHRQAYRASSHLEFKEAVLDLRALLDRYIPNLMAFADPEGVVGPHTLIPVLKRPEFSFVYPRPNFLDNEDFVVPHFLEWAMGRLATIGRTKLDRLESLPSGHPLWNTGFDFIAVLPEEIVSARPYVERVNTSDGGYVLRGFMPFRLYSYELDDRFLDMTRGLSLGYIRTIGFSDYEGDVIQYSRLFVIEDL